MAGVVGACRRETARSRRGEPADGRFCFELLRRAMGERDPAAWEAVLAQYRDLVLAWARQHPGRAPAGEDDDHWVDRAFERFWIAVGPEQFGCFGDLAGLLRFLKVCAHTVLLDEVWAHSAAPVQSLDARTRGIAAAAGAAASDLAAPDVEARAARRLAGRELWRAIAHELSDPTEQLVVYLSFALGQTPRAIHEQHPDRFPAVADVYRIKRNVLERLRRSPDIRRFLA